MAALDQYQQEHARYPSELDILVAQKYLVPIPQPNRKYSYVYFGFRDHYTLGFKHKGSADDWHCYNSLEKKWEIHDSTCFGN